MKQRVLNFKEMTYSKNMDKDKYNVTMKLLDSIEKFWCIYIPIILTVFVIAIIALFVFDIQKQVYIP